MAVVAKKRVATVKRKSAMSKARSWKDPSKVFTYAGLAITILLNGMSAGYTYGGVSYRLDSVEKASMKLEKRVEDFGAISTDMAVVKEQLRSIGATLQKLEKTLSPREGK